MKKRVMLFLLFLIISLNLIQAQEINAEVEIKDEGFLAVLKYVFSFKWLTEGVFGDTSEYGVKYCDKNLDCKDYKCKKGTAYCSDLNGECSCKEETPTDITEESGITNDEQNLIEDELLTEIPPEEPSNCEPECSYNQVCISKELDETEPNFWSSLYNFFFDSDEESEEWICTSRQDFCDNPFVDCSQNPCSQNEVCIILEEESIFSEKPLWLEAIKSIFGANDEITPRGPPIGNDAWKSSGSCINSDNLKDKEPEKQNMALFESDRQKQDFLRKAGCKEIGLYDTEDDTTISFMCSQENIEKYNKLMDDYEDIQIGEDFTVYDTETINKLKNAGCFCNPPSNCEGECSDYQICHCENQESIDNYYELIGKNIPDLLPPSDDAKPLPPIEKPNDNPVIEEPAILPEEPEEVKPVPPAVIEYIQLFLPILIKNSGYNVLENSIKVDKYQWERLFDKKDKLTYQEFYNELIKIGGQAESKVIYDGIGGSYIWEKDLRKGFEEKLKDFAELASQGKYPEDPDLLFNKDRDSKIFRQIMDRAMKVYTEYTLKGTKAIDNPWFSDVYWYDDTKGGAIPKNSKLIITMDINGEIKMEFQLFNPITGGYLSPYTIDITDPVERDFIYRFSRASRLNPPDYFIKNGKSYSSDGKSPAQLLYNEYNVEKTKQINCK